MKVSICSFSLFEKSSKIIWAYSLDPRETLNLFPVCWSGLFVLYSRASSLHPSIMHAAYHKGSWRSWEAGFDRTGFHLFTGLTYRNVYSSSYTTCRLQTEGPSQTAITTRSHVRATVRQLFSFCLVSIDRFIFKKATTTQTMWSGHKLRYPDITDTYFAFTYKKILFSTLHIRAKYIIANAKYNSTEMSVSIFVDPHVITQCVTFPWPSSSRGPGSVLIGPLPSEWRSRAGHGSVQWVN